MDQKECKAVDNIEIQGVCLPTLKEYDTIDKTLSWFPKPLTRIVTEYATDDIRVAECVYGAFAFVYMNPTSTNEFYVQCYEQGYYHWHPKTGMTKPSQAIPPLDCWASYPLVRNQHWKYVAGPPGNEFVISTTNCEFQITSTSNKTNEAPLTNVRFAHDHSDVFYSGGFIWFRENSQLYVIVLDKDVRL